MLTKYRNKFNFYGLIVIVESDSREIQIKLDKDFAFFKYEDLNEDSFLQVNVNKKKPPFEIVPNKKSTFNRKYSTSIDEGSLRYNLYKDDALTIIDYVNETVEVFSESEDLLHELSYLIILSRVGKKMDLMRVHRVHGMAFRLGNVEAVFMMEMGGGKSTLLSHMLNYPDIELISDDTPLINKLGRITPFPLRLGAYPEIIKNIINKKENIYTLNRQEFGEKVLISTDGITNKIALDLENSKQIFFQGKRIKGSSNQILKANLWQKIYYLSYNMVIGFGLPMIFEYFWETGIKDFYVKSKIGLFRLFAMCRIIIKNDFYIYEIGDNAELNAKTLYDFLIKK